MASEAAENRPAREDLPRIPGYRLESVLGRGATGVVYRAVQLAVDRPVALKILRPELVGAKRAVRRLQREAKIAARLVHPNLISAIDMGEVDGQWWYAMELVEGVSLAEKLRQDGPLTEREALRLFIPLCDALQHAYEGRVVHRDIKPANILVDDHGRPRLVDLGLAFAEDDPMITRGGGTLGTPHYISPEQARDPTAVDTRTDIWSMGATLYHAVCGCPPFEGDSVAEILSSVLYHRIPDPRSHAPNLSRGLALVIRKCLAREPERRYAEPAELMRDLERIRERRNPVVRASTLDPVAGNRPEWLTGGIAALGALALALLAWLFVERPWEAPSDDGPLAAGTPWPAIDFVRRQFEGGAWQHQQALGDLAGMRDVPEQYAIQANQLKTEIMASLGQAIDEIKLEVLRGLEADLSRHDFLAAATLLQGGLARQLRQRTGYARLEDLPPGPGKELVDWRAQQMKRLVDARDDALQDARDKLGVYYKQTIRPEVANHCKENRWAEALSLLDSGNLSWLDAAEADMRGLPDDDLRELVEGLANARQMDKNKVQDDFAEKRGNLHRWVDATADKLRGQLDKGDKRHVATLLTEAFEDELDARGIVRDQIPVRADRFEFVKEAASELEERESELVSQYAHEELAAAEAECAAMYRRRDYGEAVGLWQRRVEDPLLAPVLDTLQWRLREAGMLADLIGRAADGVTERDGDVLELYIGTISVRGTVAAGVDPLRRGFELVRETEAEPLRAYLVAPSPGQPKGTLLRSEDVERLAGLQESGASEAEQLLLALFRYHEGDVDSAYDVLPLGGSQDPLVVELRRRINAARLDTSRAQASRTEELEREIRNIKWKLYDERYRVDAKRLLARIVEVEKEFSALMTEEVRDSLRELRDKLQRAPIQAAMQPDEVVEGKNRDVTLRWFFRSTDPGAWSPGYWDLDTEGLTLRDALGPDDPDGLFLSKATCPRLALIEPFDVGSRIDVKLVFERVPHEGVDVLGVSILGVHSAFVDDPKKPGFAMDATDPEHVLRLARFGQRERFEGFPAANARFTVQFEGVNESGSADVYLSAGDGREGSGRVRLNNSRTPDNPPSSKPVPGIAIRSMRPIRLVEVEIRGKLIPD